MENRTLDFDRFLAEKRSEYVTVTVFGRPYRVKREIPALLPILLARAEETSPEALGRALLRTGDMLFGAETVDAFCREGMSAGELTALVEKTLAMICDGGKAADSETLDDEGGRTAEGQREPAKK